MSAKNYLFLLNVCVAGLSVFGLVMLYSTVFTASDAGRWVSQLKSFGVGLLLFLLIVRLDYGWWSRPVMLWILAGGCLLLLACVLVPGIGRRVNGASRWIQYLGQPSEFAKPVVILVLSAALAKLEKSQLQNFKSGFLIPLLLGLVPAGVIFLEPDWGTAILLVAVTWLMLLAAGARVWHLAATLVAGLGLLSILAATNAIRLERILVFLDPEAHRHGAGWQVWQSLLAIGSGGVSGRFLDGSLHKFGYVPEQQTDFIFARIGEETGLWGTTLVVLFIAGILWCGLGIARRARDRFGHFVALGCTAIIVLQALLNLAVATGMVPNKGLPLPFVSYGGSGLMAMFVCLGLVGSVGWRAPAECGAKKPPPAAVQLRLL